jgi:hypothetical protein
MHERIVLAEKASGDYLEQYVAMAGGPALKGLRGMFVATAASAGQPEVLVWADGGRLLTTPLVDPNRLPPVSPSPADSASPSPEPTKKP